MKFSSPRRWQSLSPILSDLLDLDASTRDQALEHLDGGNASLAADLRMLLARADLVKREHFLETPVCNVLDRFFDQPCHGTVSSTKRPHF